MKASKIVQLTLASVLSLGLLCGVGTAAKSGSADSAKPVEADKTPQAPKRKKVAYLGVYAEPIPEVLAAHLSLPAGRGLLIARLAKASPAAGAGLRRHDVLYKVNGHALVGTEDLKSLVRSFLPGDTLKLSLIRQGKPLELQVALGQLVVDEASDRAPAPQAPKAEVKPRANAQPNKLQQQFPGIPWDQLPPETAKRLRQRLDEMQKQLNGQGFGGRFPRAGQQIAPNNLHKIMERHNQEMEKLRKQMQQHMDQLRRNQGIQPGGIQPRAFNGRASSVSSQSSMSDGMHQITLTQKNNDKRLLAKDAKTGKILFDGPINTKEERSKIPAQILPKLQRMEKGTTLKLQVMPGRRPKPKGKDGLPEFN